ncbi:MAG: hypothetical protein ACXWQO_19280 [Bdellovibrionota bacterium]
MKTLLVLLALTASFPAFASTNVSVRDMRLSQDQKSLEVDVVYGGGCKEHSFVMEITSCQKSIPAHCAVEVWSHGEADPCEAMIGKTVSFSLEQVGLANYADSATIQTQDGSKTVNLPYKR